MNTRRFTISLALLAVSLMAGTGRTAEQSRVVFDFETGESQGWQVVEGSFPKLVCDREFQFHSKKAKYDKQGVYYLSTLERADNNRPDDNPTGVIESPVFTLQRPTVTFQIGGGSHATTYVALCSEDGKEVLRASGQNSQSMRRIKWDAGPYVGKNVFLRLVDKHTSGWGHVTFDDFRASGRIDLEATRLRVATRRRQLLERKQQELAAAAQKDCDSLRRAVEYLTATANSPLEQGATAGLSSSEKPKPRKNTAGQASSGTQNADNGLFQRAGKDRYPNGPRYLQRLDQLLGEMKKSAGDLTKSDELLARLELLRREALTANPLVCGQPILFVVRNQYRRDHHNTATMFQTGEINEASFQGGGALRAIDFGRGGKITTLLELPDGVVRDPEMSFDGRRVLFSMRRDKSDDYHIYEMAVTPGGTPKQLTFGSGVADIDPIWLPDGRIMFSSTREPKYCMCNRHIMGNLFVMDADGANIQQIGHGTLHEGHSALMPDGRVLYDRWEYVDRNFGDAQGLWTVNPDGTNHAVYWGNNTNSPGAVLDARIIPGTELALVNFSSCHDRPWGALAIINRQLAIDGKQAVVRTWPPEARDLVGLGNYDTFARLKIKYEDPYPLSDRFFLCSRMTGQGERMGVYLIDTFGNELLLHAEQPGCYDPMPLAARPQPMAIPPRTDLARSEGYFYVADVYQGLGMERIERGTVKWLRVVESPEKRFWTRQAWNGSGTQAPGMAYDDFNNKRILGTVPVEPDGSAYFAVPADTFVYFQILDERRMMVQSMRSGTIVRPGETTGCVGCHENRRSTGLPTVGQPAAMLRRPSKLEPWYGPPRNFSYTAEVQPVLDRHCVECHDYGKKAGEKLNLAGDLGLMFNTSYFELRSKGCVNVVGAGPYQTQKPLHWGSHSSRLAKVLVDGHEDPELDRLIKLDPESVDRIVTWIDINAPYYADYASAYRDNLYGRSPLNSAELERLGKLTGLDLKNQKHSAHVSFTRPELSPCLANKPGPERAEALAIIRAGAQRLADRPRADMAGFKLVSPIELTQEARYQARLKTEAQMRAAILEDRKQYERP